MLSILIPVHNYDCTRLIADLAAQCHRLRDELGPTLFDYELLLFDDASDDVSVSLGNRRVAESVGGHYIRSEKNVGPAFARNSLAAAARFPYLLFIDSDAAVCSDDFIARYWADRSKADVVCGALVNPSGPIPRECELRYRYEQGAAGIRSLAWKNANPYAHFTVFNALIRRDVFERSRFDERCNHYGHEDTLLGLRLQAIGASVLHTSNALVHMGIDKNETFLTKTELALRMIQRIGSPLTEQTHVARLANKVRAVGLSCAIVSVYRVSRKLLRRNLLGHHPSLLLFKFYKLGYYLRLSAGEQA